MRTEIGRVLDAGIDAAGRPFLTIRPTQGPARAGVYVNGLLKATDLIGKRIRFTCLGEAEEVDGVKVIKKIDCISSIDLIDEDAG